MVVTQLEGMGHISITNTNSSLLVSDASAILTSIMNPSRWVDVHLRLTMRPSVVGCFPSEANIMSVLECAAFVLSSLMS